MSKSEHTPGPWRYTNAAYGCSTVWATTKPVAVVMSCDEKVANARLIAAAPELLQELQRMLSVFGCLSEADYQEINPCAKARVHKARALVAKVTGSKS